MTTPELRDKIRELLSQCDESDEQQAIKSVLCSVVSAMYAHRELALMDHAAIFAEREVKRMTASRN